MGPTFRQLIDVVELWWSGPGSRLSFRLPRHFGRDTSQHSGAWRLAKIAHPFARRSLPRSRSQLRFFSVWRLS